jgi:hypothetical protein
MEKRSILIIIFLIVLFSIQFINSQQQIRVQDQQPKEEKGFFDSIWDTVTSPLFLGIFLFVVIFFLFAVGFIFLIKWLLKYFKQQNDIFFKLKQDRIKLSKTHRSYNSKHWWKIKKNTPIRLVKKEDNKLSISNPIAYHRGNYTTHEGNIIISMNIPNRKKFLFFPSTDLLIIPEREKIDITMKDERGKPYSITIDKLPRARDIIQFNESEILIFAESISNSGEFFIPVLKSKDNKIIDLTLPIYQSLKEVIIGEYLYNQSADFVDVAKKSMDLNPNIRAIQRTSDSNQNIEIPDSTIKK